MLKIATWNLCLGLQNKKFHVKQSIIAQEIDVCCMQETEVKDDFPIEQLTFPGYVIELETNDVKSRVGIYINNRVKFTRRKDLEGTNSNLIIIDISETKPVRLINIYRSFKPQENITPREKFKYQLSLIKKALTPGTILVGDFNIDFFFKFDVDYVHKNLFADFDEALSDFGLAQLISLKPGHANWKHS
jgi:exonuclease III